MPPILDTLEIETVATDTLVLNDENANEHDERSLDAIGKSLVRFGFQSPIVVSGDENVVLAGNGRVMAARRLGITHVPVVRSALADDEAAQFAVADNRTAQLSVWNATILSGLLRAASSEDRDVMGFDAGDAERFIALGSFAMSDNSDTEPGAQSKQDQESGNFSFSDDADDPDKPRDENGASLALPFVVTYAEQESINAALKTARERMRAADIDPTSRGTVLAFICNQYNESEE